MVLRRAAPLGVEIDAVVVRVPSHAIPVHMGRHCQWRHMYVCVHSLSAAAPKGIQEGRHEVFLELEARGLHAAFL